MHKLRYWFSVTKTSLLIIISNYEWKTTYRFLVSSVSSVRLYTYGVKGTLHHGSRSPALDVEPTLAGPSLVISHFGTSSRTFCSSWLHMNCVDCPLGHPTRSLQTRLCSSCKLLPSNSCEPRSSRHLRLNVLSALPLHHGSSKILVKTCQNC